MTTTSIVQLLLTLVIIGIIWWAAENALPMPAPMRVIIRAVCLIAVLLFLARWAGLL